MIVEISETAKESRAGLVAALMIVAMIVRVYRRSVRMSELSAWPPCIPRRTPLFGIILKIGMTATQYN